MRRSAEPGALLARATKFLPLIWAWLWQRPSRTLLSLTAVAIAFILYGLALGEAEGFARAAAARHVNIGQGFLLGAMAVSAVGMALILFLTANAMAQGVRLRMSEFGTLKAIGFSHRLILGLVVAEAAFPCLAGAVLGLAGAQLLFAGLALLLPPLAAFPAPVYTPVMLAVAALLALLIGAISSVLPASRIVRLDAATALAGGLRTGAPKTDGKRTAPPGATSPAILERPGRRGEERQRHLPRQIIAVARIGLSTLPQRWKNGLTIVVGVGCTVFVMHSLLAIAEGIRTGLLESGSPDRVIIHQLARFEPHLNMWDSHLPDDAAHIAAAGPGIAPGRSGAKLVVPLFFSGIDMIKRNNGNKGGTTLAGAGPGWVDATPGFHLLWGRMPRPGARELIAGRNALGKFSTLDSGVVEYRKLRWRIVGGFATGDWWDGYLVGDIATIQAAAKDTRDSAVLVKLKSPDAFAAFRQATQPRLPPDVIVERETDHYAGVWRSVPNNVYYITYLLAALIAAGVMAATTHTMQVTADGKAAETACLRMLGFDARAIAIALVLEALLLAALGAAAGTFGVWLWLDGFLYNGAGNIFRVVVNLHLLLVALGWGLVIALFGVARPALRIARQTPIEALREV